MSRTSALGNFTLLPVLADAADITQVGTTMADRIEKYVLMRFTSVANRDAVVTSPEQGMHCVTTDLGRIWVYSGAAWVFLGYYLAAGRPGVILTDAGQTITTATATQITWGTEVSDVDGWTAGGIALLTVPAGWAGRYLVSYQGAWSGGVGAAAAVVAVHSDGVRRWEGGQAGGFFGYPVVTFLATLAVADNFYFQVYQSSGANRDITSRLEITWLGP